MGSADDDQIADLVAERRVMRDELRALRAGAAGNVIALDALRRVR